jgi:hypothetical protein
MDLKLKHNLIDWGGWIVISIFIAISNLNWMWWEYILFYILLATYSTHLKWSFVEYQISIVHQAYKERMEQLIPFFRDMEKDSDLFTTEKNECDEE